MKTELEKIFSAFHTGDYTYLLNYMHFRICSYEECRQHQYRRFVKDIFSINNNF